MKNNKIILWIKNNKIKLAIIFLLLAAYYFCLPKTLFNSPYATVIESENGELLGAKIADDGQWRFPEPDSIPYKFKTCIIAFEDQHFYKHFGINPVSVWNAFRQNQKAGRVVRGGSTLTQQVIRLSRENKKRTYGEKFVEAILSTRLEFRYSKESILELYAAHAPFGGNVVGLEMASWRYFGVKPHQLSWAESATLAVLPNAPSLIYPGKNQEILRQKRNRLLKKLYEDGVFDKLTYELSLEEPLPQKPFDLPQIAPHLLERIVKENKGKRIQTTIDLALQERVNHIAKNYYNQYKQNEIHNLAILVVDVETRNIIAYVGNSPTDIAHKKDVDIITAPRSTGSILKPLLYASMLDESQLLPTSLVPDIPTQISGYSPQNFSNTYDGAVSAKRALSRSLNIPSVLMLQEYGIYNFYEKLQKYKLRDISKHPNHYGLSLILGGAESNLWDLCKTYASLTSTLNFFTQNQSEYRENEFSELNFYSDKKMDFGSNSSQKNIVGAGSIYLTYQAMREVNRPEGGESWRFYDSSLPIAWKTGTSFGNRDAWAIGTTQKYVVGVWVGNATGEGRPELTGVSSAAPILFDIFSGLLKSDWFPMPLDDLEEVTICAKSGNLATENCPTTLQYVPLSENEHPMCTYQRIIHLDKTETFRVNASCESTENIQTQSWFVLPPVMEWYYKSKNADYLVLPPFREDCQPTESYQMDFIYPKADSKIYLTKDFESEVQPIILKVAHSNPKSTLHWYLDRTYLGQTKDFHEMPITAKTGSYYVTVVDESGYEIVRNIEIVE
ncbi:MAG: penicillin-binding protein 1C [Flavobacteriaceae bacterium]|nr:penicillin-binding protein 1C [Flavobacteriaceae bacterium]